MRSLTMKSYGVAAIAIAALLGIGSGASALVITGGPVYNLPGGGSCTVTNVTTTGSGATVTCNGVNLAAHTRVYFGIKNDTIINGASTNGSGISGAELFTTFLNNNANTINYSSTSAMVSACASGTCSTANGGVPQTLSITRTAGSATIVSTGGTPGSNGNGAIERLFRLDSGSSFTFDVDITGTSGSFSGQLCGVYDSAHSTSGGGGCASRVDLAFYFSDCGDGVVDSPEQCDLAGQNGAATSCCTSTCTFRSNGATCRAASGVCDAVETCTGASGNCPADGFLNSSTLCRAGSGDSCDVNEFCTGSSSACPADDAPTKFGVVCNPGSGDLCDPNETCTGIPGQTCPSDNVASAGTTCRVGSGDACDTTETCTGVANQACPADDAPSNAGNLCRAGSGDSCDVDETCTGVPGQTCPADDAPGNAGNVCNAGSGDLCDPDETCTGVPGETCPSDTVTAGGTLCRAGSGDACDVDELCTGTADQPCPTDDAPGNAGNVCRPGSGDLCDPDETCTGVPGQTCPGDIVASAGTVCNAGSGDSCDPDETCSGTALDPCPSDTVTSAGTVCRTGSGDMCDVDETCTGVADQACPADDAPGNAGNVCNPGSGDLCDPDETCTGTPGETCPTDNVEPSTTECRADAGDCDVAEFCTGNPDETCPVNGFEPAGTDCPNTTLCDGDETCDGNGSCVGGPTLACDDNSACTVDTCDALLGCVNTGTPVSGCLTAFQKGVLLVNEKNPGKEKVVAKFIKGPPLTQTDFGNPLVTGGTTYDVCIFDAFDQLAGSFTIDRAGDLCDGRDCFKKLGQAPPNGKGYKFKDNALTSDGVQLVLMKGGGPGKSKILVKTKNSEGTMPTGIAAALAAGVPAGSTAKMQFVPDGEPGGLPAGTVCLEVVLNDIKKNDGTKFKAKK